MTASQHVVYHSSLFISYSHCAVQKHIQQLQLLLLQQQLQQEQQQRNWKAQCRLDLWDSLLRIFICSIATTLTAYVSCKLPTWNTHRPCSMLAGMVKHPLHAGTGCT